jgi:molecular chaperone HtpG
LLSDRVDEWVVGHVTEFEGKPLVSVAKGGLDLGSLEDETEKKEREQESSDLSDLFGRIKSSLGERVKDVRVTHRLTESPACLVADEHDMSGNLARLLKAAGQPAPARSRSWRSTQAPGRTQVKTEDKKFDDWSSVLLDQALLAEGGQLDDPATFVKRINALMLEMSGDAPRIIVPG